MALNFKERLLPSGRFFSFDRVIVFFFFLFFIFEAANAVLFIAAMILQTR